MADWILLFLGFALLLTGILGSVLPILPGPPISWLGMLFCYYTSPPIVTDEALLYGAILAGAITALDYYAPVWGTKKFGGTKAGSWGSGIGLIVGIFFPPIGFVLGPFLGAFLFELMVGTHKDAAFKAAIGSFIGFLIGTLAKLIISIGMLIYCIYGLF